MSKKEKWVNQFWEDFVLTSNSSIKNLGFIVLDGAIEKINFYRQALVIAGAIARLHCLKAGKEVVVNNYMGPGCDESVTHFLGLVKGKRKGKRLMGQKHAVVTALKKMREDAYDQGT